MLTFTFLSLQKVFSFILNSFTSYQVTIKIIKELTFSIVINNIKSHWD